MYVCYVCMSVRWRIGMSVCFGSFVCFLCFTQHITNLCICDTHTNAKHTRNDTRTRTRTPSMHKFDKHRNLVCADSRLMQELATQIPTFRARNTSPRRSTLAGVWQGRGVLEPRSWPNCEGRTLDMRYFYVWCWVCPDPALRARQSRERRWSDLILTTSASRTRKSMIDSAVAGMY